MLCDIGAHNTIKLIGGSVGHVVVSELEADTYMCHQLLTGEATMAQTTDCDINLLSGGITLSKFTNKKFELRCTSECKLRDATKSRPQKSKAKFKPAKFPIFDGVK